MSNETDKSVLGWMLKYSELQEKYLDILITCLDLQNQIRELEVKLFDLRNKNNGVD
jgi:hypothetical protein